MMDRSLLTDLGNSERFVRDHVHVLRYVGTWGKWIAYDGKRWVLDQQGQAENLAKETVRRMLLEAQANLEAVVRKLGEEADCDGDPVDQKRKLKEATYFVAWALRCHDAKQIASMIKLARSSPQLAVTHNDFDVAPMLLNVGNGTLDLENGKLRKHDPADLITKLAPVDFDPRATCPTWDAFLRRAMADDEETIDFLRRMQGYALTGVIREHVLGFLFGGGANGKSTFLSTMHAMLGDYAIRAPRGLLFRAKGERHDTGLTTLHGARFVSCAEVEEGAYFDEAIVKDLTGGDAISARRMREDYWTFTPTHKLFLAGNHKPLVRGSDEGIWRRIRLVPWLVTIPEGERDTELVTKLRAELSGILAWAVRGCAEWQRSGLGEPKAVTDATADYREESDPLREFVELHCIVEPDGRISRQQLRVAYTEFCEENGGEPVKARRFTESLRTRGVTEGPVKVMGKVKDGWKGIRLATEPERDRGHLRPVGGRGQVGSDSVDISLSAPARNDSPRNSPYQAPTTLRDGAAE